jgi:hypothetical protein
MEVGGKLAGESYRPSEVTPPSWRLSWRHLAATLRAGCPQDSRLEASGTLLYDRS